MGILIGMCRRSRSCWGDSKERGAGRYRIYRPRAETSQEGKGMKFARFNQFQMPRPWRQHEEVLMYKEAITEAVHAFAALRKTTAWGGTLLAPPGAGTLAI